MASSTPTVLISIINWNGGPKTIRCLESINQLAYPNFHILVVDNASADGSVEQIRAAFPKTDFVLSPENIGFAAGHRLALERARQNQAELLWVLNNDTIVQPNTLTALVEAYLRHGEGLYGSVPLDTTDETRVRLTAWAIDDEGKPCYLGKQAVSWGDLYQNWAGRQEQRVANISGSSFMVPLCVADKHGFMDETYFLYGEEVDYCFRLGQAGIPVFVVPTSTVFHDLRGSVQLHPQIDAIIQYYKTRNELRMIKEYLGSRAYVEQVRTLMKKNGCVKRWLKARLSAKRMRESAPLRYYRCLAVWHSLVNRTGKTIAPEKFID